MAFFGCEVSPVNEGALRTLRSAIASCIAFTTSRKATDLTFAVGSRGRDVDPDVEIVCRRTLGIRRCMAKCEESRDMIKDIYKGYQKRNEPGIYKNEEDLKGRIIAGEPGTTNRARQRRRRRPHGPVGFLLESLFLQAAALSPDLVIMQ